MAVDAMGGDRGVVAVVEGVVRACNAGLGPVILVGDEARIRAELDRAGVVPSDVTVQHAAEQIGMAEHPGRAARTKRDSSMHVGFGLVRDHKACAFVSAGNTGAMMAVGLLTLRRIRHCDRPVIASALPTRRDPVVLLDLGANVDCRAAHLVQFALMGAAFAELHLGRPRPTVALLSNGSEPTKGTETLREAHRLLAMTDLKYIGYVEGNAVAQGEVDVVVTDGFVGNIVLKVTEGVAAALLDRLRDQLRGDWLGSLGAFLMRRTLRRVQEDIDWANIGGAPLLGLDGIGVVAHGGSSPRAIANAVRAAREFARIDLVRRLRNILDEQGPPIDQTATSELPITRASGSHEQL